VKNNCLNNSRSSFQTWESAVSFWSATSAFRKDSATTFGSVVSGEEANAWDVSPEAMKRQIISCFLFLLSNVTGELTRY
jgi:hypothetical protein